MQLPCIIRYYLVSWLHGAGQGGAGVNPHHHPEVLHIIMVRAVMAADIAPSLQLVIALHLITGSF
jgi:hypothetical protein